MSGRRREIPLEWIFERTVLLLRVSLESLSEDAQERTIAYQKEGQPPGSFVFSFRLAEAIVEDVLWSAAPAALEAGQTVRFVSEDVQRSKQWNLMKERDGNRKIMYYDENAAFEEPLASEGSALLLLRGVDDDLSAHCASMGRGLLPLRYRQQALRALVKDEEDDAAPPLPAKR